VQPAHASSSVPDNRLARETSPYLLQHARNPVDWFPWGPEALEKARREDKPIFLSIGYSACHWCHVMAHESFENAAVAEVMNRLYVNIKVDREERPDLDHLYMQAVMAMTGSGGWPMSVWLTPDLEPFFGGTYFPPDSRYGRPGFRAVLEGISRAWKERRADILRDAGRMAEALQAETRLPAGTEELSRDPLPKAAEGLKKHFDADFGGFGGAPKFPPSMDLEVLLREHARTGEGALLAMAEVTLDRMARGGMYDQIGGGFHRYSTDEKWLIPHFEKMLYDNALLSRVYLHAWQATGKAGYSRIVRETCDYVLREMQDEKAGGFYAAQDADSEGVEGKFFAWTPAEVRQVLGAEDAAVFCKAYDVSAGGNFEHGASALWLPDPVSAEMDARLAPMRAKLLAVREKRIKPGLDSKILADWNGLMIRALAEAGFALDEPRYLAAARRAVSFCLSRRKDGRLMHAEGVGGFLDDHAFLASGCLSLLEATGEGRWLTEAGTLATEMEKSFRDASDGAFFFTPDGHEKLPARSKHPGDNALPSGNSVAASVLLKLGALTGEKRWRDLGEGTLKAFSAFYGRQPRGFAEMLCALDFATSETVEIVVVGAPGSRKPLLDALRNRFLPNALILPVDPAAPLGIPLAEGRGLVDGKPAAYVCRAGTCRVPVTEPSQLSTR